MAHTLIRLFAKVLHICFHIFCTLFFNSFCIIFFLSLIFYCFCILLAYLEYFFGILLAHLKKNASFLYFYCYIHQHFFCMFFSLWGGRVIDVQVGNEGLKEINLKGGYKFQIKIGLSNSKDETTLEQPQIDKKHWPIIILQATGTNFLP